jgi:peroxiredoxin
MALFAAAWPCAGKPAALVDADLAPSEEADAGIDAKAQQVLQSLAHSLSAMKACYAEVRMETRLTSGGRTISSFETTGALWLRRPSRFVWVCYSGPAGAMACICDGTNVLRYCGASNRYITAPAAEEAAWDGPVSPMNSPVLSQIILSTSPSETVSRVVSHASLLGRGFLETQPADRLKIRTDAGKGADEELLVATGNPQVALRYVSTRTMPTGTLVSTVRDLRILAHAGFPDSTFAVDPPAGAMRVTKVWDLFVRPPKPAATPKALKQSAGRVSRFGMMTDAALPDPWVGNPAPDFVLGTLDGRMVRLSDLRGRNVVVLDFFATWCGPCRASLPEMIQIGNEMQSAGVAFFAVDQEEDAAKVRTFLAGMVGNPRVEVLLDTTGAVGNAYGATAIPRTVVVGRDGMIKAVYSGAGVGDQVRRDIQSALR